MELFVTYSDQIEAYPGLPQTSKMESFTKIVNSWKPLTIAIIVS